MKTFFLIGLFIAYFVTLFGLDISLAQEKKKGQGSIVQLKVGQAYIVIPKKSERSYPFVLIVPDTAGLNSYFISEADAYAEMGAVAIVIDFYRGKWAKNEGEISKLNPLFNPNYLKNVLRSSFNLIQSRSDVKQEQGVLITYGNPGQFVLSELKNFSIRGTVLISVPPIMETQELKGVSGNFFLIYEEQSQEIPKSLVVSFQKVLSELNIQQETKFLSTGKKRWWDYSEKSSYNIGIGAVGRQFIIDSVSKIIPTLQKENK